MRTYLYTGTERSRDLARLVNGFAALQVPICVVSFDGRDQDHPLTAQAETACIDLLRVRLPGLGLPRRYAPHDEVLVQTALATLGQIITSGAYRLVVLDGIREATARNLLDADDLRQLIRVAPEGTEIAMT
jgi:ATP:corrinoid adenosyltransferase